MMYDDLVQILLKRGNHVFWHSVATHRSSHLETDIAASLPSGVAMSWVDCRNLPVDEQGDLLVSRLDTSGDLLCVVNVEHLLGLRRGHALLRQLRPPATGVLDDGRRLLVLSNRPQSDFPVIDGSMVVHDALPAHLRPLSDEAVREHPLMTQLSAGQQESFRKSAKGFRGVLSRIGEATRAGDVTGAIVLPDRPTRDALLVEVVSDALVELGDAVLGTVMVTVDTVGRRVPSDDLEERCFVRMRSAGLLRVDHGTDEVVLFPGMSDDQVQGAVALADMKTKSSSLWSQVSENVFFIERCIRHLLGRRMQGPVQSKFIKEHAEEIDRNWRQDSALSPEPASSGPIAPLNYVNLSDLLSLARELAEIRHVGGLGSAGWRELADDVVPVRNRVGHMRLPSSMDFEITQRWRRVLAKAIAGAQD